MSSYTMNRQTLDEGANMLPSVRPARRAIKGAIGTGALAGAMLFGAAPRSGPAGTTQPQSHRRARPPNWPA